MDGLVEEIALAMAAALGDEWEFPIVFMLEYKDTHETCRDVYRDMAKVSLEAMREPVIAMFRATLNPTLPKLTPEQYWDAMIEEVVDDDDD